MIFREAIFSDFLKTSCYVKTTTNYFLRDTSDLTSDKTPGFLVNTEFQRPKDLGAGPRIFNSILRTIIENIFLQYFLTENDDVLTGVTLANNIHI